MVKLSAVIPVHKDDKIIVHCLQRIISLVDEVVIVSGAPEMDAPDVLKPEIANIAGDKLSWINYRDKVWHKDVAIRQGIDRAEHEWVMPLSADMLVFGLEQAVASLDSDPLIVCGNQINLWRNIWHTKDCVRMYCIAPKAGWPHKELKLKDWRFVPEFYIYHLGWLRPFHEQIAKHRRHIERGLWEDLGTKVLELDDQGQESWAIHHVLRYRNDSGENIFPPEFIVHHYDTWGPTNQMDEYVRSYEERHGVDFYTGIMNAVPPELIV